MLNAAPSIHLGQIDLFDTPVCQRKLGPKEYCTSAPYKVTCPACAQAYEGTGGESYAHLSDDVMIAMFTDSTLSVEIKASVGAELQRRKESVTEAAQALGKQSWWDFNEMTFLRTRMTRLRVALND